MIERRRNAIEDVINQAIAKRQIPGAVLYASHKFSTEYSQAFGVQSYHIRSPMALDTVFDLASLTKPMACVSAIMILAERGKLRLHDPAALYLPNFGVKERSQITIEQLLLHIGGLAATNPLCDYLTGRDAAILAISNTPTLFPPGTSFCYSDLGYIVLGEIAQIVAGRPLDVFAREEIFEPMGLVDTYFNPPTLIQKRCASTGKRNDQWLCGEVHDPRSAALGGAAGHAGLFSTAIDIGRFCECILRRGISNGRRVMSEATTAEMLEPRQLPNGFGWRSYAFDIDTYLSFIRSTHCNRQSNFTHTGYTGTMLWIDSNRELAVVFLTNAIHAADPPSIRELRQHVCTLIAEAFVD